MKRGRGVKLKQGLFAGKTVYMGSREKIGRYDERLQEMLSDCFGIGGALLTDLSQLSDFSPSEQSMEKLRRDYDSRAQQDDTLLCVAQRIWGGSDEQGR